MIIEELIETYAPKQAEFEVTLPKGEKLTFRAVTDYAELSRLKAGAAKFAKMCRSNRCNADLKKQLPSEEDGDETILVSFVLSATIVEPKLTQKDFLTLAKSACYAFNTIVDQWNLGQTNIQIEDEAEYIEDLKND
jgi:hypothetical protein